MRSEQAMLTLITTIAEQDVCICRDAKRLTREPGGQTGHFSGL